MIYAQLSVVEVVEQISSGYLQSRRGKSSLVTGPRYSYYVVMLEEDIYESQEWVAVPFMPTEINVEWPVPKMKG